MILFLLYHLVIFLLKTVDPIDVKGNEGVHVLTVQSFLLSPKHKNRTNPQVSIGGWRYVELKKRSFCCTPLNTMIERGFLFLL